MPSIFINILFFTILGFSMSSCKRVTQITYGDNTTINISSNTANGSPEVTPTPKRDDDDDDSRQ